MESTKLWENTTKRLSMFQTMAKVKSSSILSKTYINIVMFSGATEVTFCNFFFKKSPNHANRLWCIQTSSGTSSWRYVYKNLKLKWFQDIRVFSDYVDSHCGNSQGYNDCKAHLYLQWKIYVVELLLLFIILFILFIVLLLLILKLVNREAEQRLRFCFFAY